MELTDACNSLMNIVLKAKIIRGLPFNVNYFQTFENVKPKGVLPKEMQALYVFPYVFSIKNNV